MRKENDKANKTKQARTKTKTKTKELQNTAQEAKKYLKVPKRLSQSVHRATRIGDKPGALTWALSALLQDLSCSC